MWRDQLAATKDSLHLVAMSLKKTRKHVVDIPPAMYSCIRQAWSR